jgi:hypothetical protein
MRKIESTLRMFAFSGKLKNLFAFSHTLSTKHCVNGTYRRHLSCGVCRVSCVSCRVCRVVVC